ncbi:unnamed protein product [Rangifer tarandus platyrhynchus]|uniref:Uncharacterized protein n=1 Tax=Rangifer tarandus platyrhynchus TaxID=3082113 RepID=A0AC59Z2I5_RANTA
MPAGTPKSQPFLRFRAANTGPREIDIIIPDGCSQSRGLGGGSEPLGEEHDCRTTLSGHCEDNSIRASDICGSTLTHALAPILGEMAGKASARLQFSLPGSVFWLVGPELDSNLGFKSQGFLKKWHLYIASLGTAEEATQRFPCPVGAAARRARQRQVNRWHIRDSPSQAPEGGRRPASPPPPRSRGRHWAGAGHIPLHLPSVPAGGKACGGAHLLVVLMPTVQLSHSAGLTASHQQRGAERALALFFSRS